MTEFEWREVFADRLREMMELRNMANRDLAIKSGIGDRVISNFLSLDKTPSINTLLKLCNALGCTMDKLVV